MDSNPYLAPSAFQQRTPIRTVAFTPETVFRIVIASVGVWYLLEGVTWLFQAAFSVLFQGNGTEVWFAARGIFEILAGVLAVGGRWPFSAMLRLFTRYAPEGHDDEMPPPNQEESPQGH